MLGRTTCPSELGSIRRSRSGTTRPCTANRRNKDANDFTATRTHTQTHARAMANVSVPEHYTAKKAFSTSIPVAGRDVSVFCGAVFVESICNSFTSFSVPCTHVFIITAHHFTVRNVVAETVARFVRVDVPRRNGIHLTHVHIRKTWNTGNVMLSTVVELQGL